MPNVAFAVPENKVVPSGAAVEIRSMYPAEFGLDDAVGIAYDPASGTLLIAEDDPSPTILEIRPDEEMIGSFVLPPIDDASAISFDATSSSLVATRQGDLVTVDLGRGNSKAADKSGGRQVGQANGSAVDPVSGDVYVLRANSAKVQRITATGETTEILLKGLQSTRLSGIAFHPSEHRLYLASEDGKSLHAVSTDGALEASFDLSALAISNLESIVFAPSADHTDASSVIDLYVLDAGQDSGSARVIEATLASVTAPAALSASASLVRTTDLSMMPIPSPDSAGVAWIRHQGRLLVVDSEVNEMPWLFNANQVNVYPMSYGGSLFTSQVGNTVPTTKEPTGVTYNPTNTHIFTSDDDADKVFEFNPGPDGRYATSDDTITSLNVRPFGNLDGEDVAYDTATGDLWVIDGVDREVFRYTPGPDGKFGTGDDPAPTHWDVGVYGALDPEGIVHYAIDDTIMVLDGRSKKIYVLSKSGALIQTISITAANSVKAAGLTLAPPSNGGSGLNFYIVDRGVDNNSNPNENDGRLYEMSAGLGGDPVNLPPTASAAAPPSQPGATLTITTSTFPIRATLDASGSRDPENGPLIFEWSKVSGPSASIISPSAAVTGVDLSAVGTYSFSVTVTDSGTPALSASASVQIVVQPPGGSVTFQGEVASGSDDAEETVSTGSVQLASSDLDMVLDGATHKSTGLRFAGVTIPSNASITSASIQFRSDEKGSAPVSLTIAGEATDDAKTFTSSKRNLSSRPLTAARVTWSPPAWTLVNQAGADQRTSDLAPIVQELVNRTGWSSGNAMAFLISGSATGTRVADALEGGFAPVLTVTYTTGGPPVNQPPVASAAAPPSPPGTDLTITASAYPVTATLDASASYDPEGGPLTYLWTNSQGSGGATVVSPTSSISQVRFDSPGSYVFDLTTTDTGSPPLSATASVRIVVQSGGGGSTTLQAAIATDSDDAEETISTGNIQLTSTDLDMVLDGSVHKMSGLRFTNIAIPQNSTITSAVIQFRSDEAGSAPVTLTISGQAADNPAPFVGTKFDLSARARTSLTVPWAAAPWPVVNQAGPDQRTPDLSPIVQQLVGRAGWSSGNAMVFFITGPPTGTRVADSIEGGYAPVLTITYTSP